MGPYRSVVIGDYEILKDVFRLDATTDRPPMWQFLNQYFRYGNGQDSRGIVFRLKNFTFKRNYNDNNIRYMCENDRFFLVAKTKNGKNKEGSH